MTDPVQTPLTGLRRPKLLIRAARFGLENYDRERDLRRLMQLPATPAPAQAVPRLLDEEDRLNHARKSGGAAYSPARHVEVLIALMAEARALSPAGQAA